jgi:hypothetical protein
VLDADLRAMLHQHDQALRQARQSSLVFSRQRFLTHEGLVLALGETFISQKLPYRFRRQAPKACYWNTLALVRRNPRLTYCEGIALPMVDGWVSIPVKHAWACTEDGRVVDVTWPEPEHSAYVGLRFTHAEDRRFRSLMPRDEMGILDGEWRLGFPLLHTGRLFPEEVEDDEGEPA